MTDSLVEFNCARRLELEAALPTWRLGEMSCVHVEATANTGSI